MCSTSLKRAGHVDYKLNRLTAKHKMHDRATGGRRKPQQWQKVKADILRFPKWYDT